VCAVETWDQSDEIQGLVLDLPFDDHERILDLLDVREKCGYIRKVTRAFEFDSHAEIGEVFIFCAYRDDPGISVFICPRNGIDNTVDELQRIASTIRSAEGPSGKNLDYLRQLYDTLGRLGLADEHVNALLELCS
jgi:cation transport regulator ChaC